MKSVVVIGNIGSGKTSFVREFKRNNPHWRAFFEFNKVNPFLSDFYSNHGRWCFASQVAFITNSIETGLMVKTCDTPVIQDWSWDIHFDVFTQTYYDSGFITHAEFMQLERMSDIASLIIPAATKYIYLSVSPETAIKRAEARGRGFEKSLALIEELNTRYAQFTSKIESSGKKIIHIDADALDLRKVEDYEIVERLVKSE